MENKKRILTYGLFCESVYGNKEQNFSYLTLQETPKGLKITLNDEGREFLDDLKGLDNKEYDGKMFSESSFAELFDDVQGNSEYLFVPNLGDANLEMTGAPGILDGYVFSEDGYDEGEESQLFYHGDYMTTNFVQELYDNGSVVFDRA